jgi:hypothetical protein
VQGAKYSEEALEKERDALAKALERLALVQRELAMGQHELMAGQQALADQQDKLVAFLESPWDDAAAAAAAEAEALAARVSPPASSQLAGTGTLSMAAPGLSPGAGLSRPLASPAGAGPSRAETTFRERADDGDTGSPCIRAHADPTATGSVTGQAAQPNRGQRSVNWQALLGQGSGMKDD